jgi:hypothetical protein
MMTAKEDSVSRSVLHARALRRERPSWSHAEEDMAEVITLAA